MKESHYNYYVNNGTQYIVYNTLYGGIVLLAEGEYEKLKHPGQVCEPELAAFFTAQGYWVPKVLNEPEKYLAAADLLGRRDKGEKLFLTVLPTLKCNARCFYCFENGVKRIDMEKETAQKLVEFIGSFPKVKHVGFSWFGGEPMMNRDLIQYLCDWMLIKGIHYSSSMVTNGYLLCSPEIIKDAKRYWNLRQVQISLDGLPDTYRERKNYIDGAADPFAQVMENIEMLSAQKITVSIRMNIDQNNVEETLALCRLLGSRFGENKYVTAYGAFITGTKEEAPDAIRDSHEKREVLKRVLDVLMEVGLCQPKKLFLVYPKISACMYDSKDSFLISPDGSVCLCENECGRPRDQIGSIMNEEGIQQILTTPRVSRGKSIKCMDCVLLPRCMGGCQSIEKLGMEPCFDLKESLDILLRALPKNSGEGQ